MQHTQTKCNGDRVYDSTQSDSDNLVGNFQKEARSNSDLVCVFNGVVQHCTDLEAAIGVISTLQLARIWLFNGASVNSLV